MGKRNVALLKQVSFKDSFKDSVLDKIQKDLGELIEKQDRILQRFKKELSQKSSRRLLESWVATSTNYKTTSTNQDPLYRYSWVEKLEKKLKKTIIDK